jgi:transposase
MLYHFNDEEMIPDDHPLRRLLPLVNDALRGISSDLDRIYAADGRRSIPPERLLRALLLQALYGIRSERLLVEQLHYNFLFRWFVGLGPNDPVWHPTSFTKNRDRLIDGDIAKAFFAQVVAIAQQQGLMSDEHFSVDGTLIEAFASHKSFRPKDDDSDDDGEHFHGSKRSNETHESVTDPDARLYRKSKAAPAQLAYMGHVLMENRHALIAGVDLTLATGFAEREAALSMIEAIPGRHRITVGADRGYDVGSFVAGVRELGVTPHIAANDARWGRSRINGRTLRHASYGISQFRRKSIEKIFGWIKAFAGYRKTRHRGRRRVGWQFTFLAAAYNLMRIRNLAGAAA